MKLHRKLFPNSVLCLIAVLPLAILTAAPAFAQTVTPAVVSSIGYINGTPQTTHTTAAFNSGGASTLVAFVSTHPAWPWPGGQPVSITGLSDNVGNAWNVLTGPTLWAGSSYTLLSAIYYVNAPITSAAHTLTVQLTNPAPLVVHVFAVSGSGPPIYSAITGPSAGGTSADVTSAPISVGANSLLLGWVKNETSATATALDGYTLDTQSTGYLWAESQTALTAGSYTGHFQYDAAIGWQTAIVGLQPSAAPVAFSQSVMTDQDTAASITLTAVSPKGFQLTYTVVTGPTHGTLTGTAPNLTYTPNAGYVGSDAFTFKANDGTGDSNTATVSITVRSPGPAVLSSSGYINGNPQTTHTAAAFNSGGASTLVAFVSTHPAWPWPGGLPVSITGLSDNVGNTWNVLTGPTQWAGSSFTLLSAIYYVNAPITSATHTLTVQLTNPAPLVVHVFAVSGSDITGPPIYSAITGPGAGGTSADVTTAPISVPTNSLLLGWAKNETSATATALDGYTLDAQSTSFLWAESQTALTVGSYTGHFQYNTPIGWQTAIVGLKQPGVAQAPPTPAITSAPANPTNQTNASFSFTDSEAGAGFLCQLDGSAFSSCSSPVTYSGPLTQGSHTFAVKAQDAAGNQSSAASFTWTVDTTPPPIPAITSTPANPTNQTSASFGFADSEAGVSFLCQLDGSAFSSCSSPVTYSGPLAQGSHTFAVKAQDAAGNQSGAASFTWTVDTTPPPTPSISSTPANPTNQTNASISFTDSEAGASFLCQLDGSAFSSCSSPVTYSGPLAQGSHTFAVKAQDAAGNQSGAASFAWTVDTTAPPTPAITSTPANPTNQTSASFSITDSEGGVSFLCQLDGSTFSSCSSPVTYPGLSQASHMFAVKAQDAAGNQSGAASFTWTVDTTAPPTPSISSAPANPTNQTSASFGLTDSEAGVSFLCQLDSSAFSACSSPKTYSGLTQTSHTFSVKAQDTAGNQSGAASFTWAVDTTVPPTPAITSTPANPTNQTSASFGFTDSEAGVSLLCRLDGSAFSTCLSPATYSGPLAQGSHKFAVKAQDAAGNQSATASFTWTVDTTAPPTPAITATPANPTNKTSASFSLTDKQAGVSFLCQLDGSAFSACASRVTYSGLSQANHTFSVEAQDAAGNQSGAASFTWTVDTTAPPTPAITSTPANPTNQTSASFGFTDSEAGVSLLCRLDGSAFSTCLSPATYSGPLAQGSHKFAVKAQDAAGNQSATASFTWTVDTTAPPTPAITSKPPNPTNQTSASFSFTDKQAGVSFLCQLDGSAFSACASPVTYSGLSQANHTFSVEAQDAAGNQSGAANFTWTITP
jgi:hypothetical protein